MKDREETACPPLADLLRVSEGEGTSAERRALSAHLWRCERCRERLAGVESLATECATAFVSPAAMAPDEARRFAEGLHQHRGVVDTVRRAPLTWLSMAAAVTAFIVGILLTPSQTTVVRADDLLDRAERFEASHQTTLDTPRRLRLRWAPASIAARAATAYPPVSAVRLVSDERISEAWADDATLRMLSNHGVDWRQPHGVGAIRRWRHRLGDRRERVSVTGELLTLRIATAESRLRLVEIAVRQDTYAVVREAFVIDGIGRLDIEALVEPARGRAVAPPPVTLRAENPTPSGDRAMLDVLEQAELRARHALHATGLDLGADVRVSKTARQRVQIDGVASFSARRALTARLGRDPLLDVTVRVRDREAIAPVLPLSPGAPMRQWLNRTFGDAESDAKANFLPELAAATRLTSQRLDALVALEHRYAAGVLAEISPTARASFQALLDRHYADLNETLNRLAGKTAVLQGSPSGLPVAFVGVPTDWSVRVRRGAAEAATLEQLLPSLVSPNDGEEVTASREAFAATVHRLWLSVNSRPVR